MTDEYTPEQREQVRTFVKIVEEDYGISVADLRDAVQHFQRIKRISNWMAYAMATSVAAGFLYMVWEGFVHILKAVSKIH